MFEVNSGKLAFITGRFMHRVYVLAFEGDPTRLGSIDREIGRLYEARGFSMPFETVFPATFAVDKNACYFLAARNGEETPQVLTYKFKNFLKQPKKNYFENLPRFKLPPLNEIGRLAFETDYTRHY
jgi:hypothetical protein